MTWAEDVLALEPLFRRAPSAHNTQPWVLRQVGDESLTLHWDPARELVIADPTRRDLWLSLGAFVEAISIAAAASGLEPAVAWSIDGARHQVAALTPSVEQSGVPPQVLFTVDELTSRAVNRGRYRQPGLDQAAVDAVAGEAAIDRTMFPVVPAELIDRLLPCADTWTYGTPAQVAELRNWLRLNKNDPRYLEDGLSDTALGLSRLQARALDVALRPAVWALLRRLGGPRLLAASSVIGGRGTVVAYVGTADTADQVAEHGRSLLRYWLAAARLGLAVHPLSSLIDAPVTRAELAGSVAGRGESVLSVFRIGVPLTEAATSARRRVPVVRFDEWVD